MEKMRYKLTDERTDGTEIIGPSGKIPGTNDNNNTPCHPVVLLQLNPCILYRKVGFKMIVIYLCTVELMMLLHFESLTIAFLEQPLSEAAI